MYILFWNTTVSYGMSSACLRDIYSKNVGAICVYLYSIYSKVTKQHEQNVASMANYGCGLCVVMTSLLHHEFA